MIIGGQAGSKGPSENRLLVFIPFDTIEMRVVDWMVYTCVDRGEPSRGDRRLSLSDREVIESRIRDVNDALQLLSHLMLRGFEELSVHEKLSMRYLVIQLVEASASICVRVLISLYNESIESYAQCFYRVAAKGVIPGDLAHRLASAARLRNLLVHRYWAISDRRVYESVKEGLRDFENYIRYVKLLLEGSCHDS
jgi:uncharacterized protein YutE (UPF0331/DUF86 family)